MKTTEEIVDFFMATNAEFYSINFDNWKKQARQALIKLLEEHSQEAMKKQRHACAEAITDCTNPRLITINEAHSACINAGV